MQRSDNTQHVKKAVPEWKFQISLILVTDIYTSKHALVIRYHSLWPQGGSKPMKISLFISYKIPYQVVRALDFDVEATGLNPKPVVTVNLTFTQQ